ncbi:MAG: flagellar biosynthetic protein FliQ [Proteobacteria bacterium]|jgi:flagellar biosynthetic protein FliQ|nr:flagellar biosynthetic protein FliQ [Pseudomonadota bacterium]
MIPADLYDVARQGLVLAVAVSLPLLGAALLASILSGALQSLTRLSEPAITQVSRILAVLACAVAAGPWIAGEVKQFAAQTFALIHELAR